MTIARATDSSETETISFTYVSSSGAVTLPIALTAIPSAIDTGVILPAYDSGVASRIESAHSEHTPMINTSGRTLLIAVATPAAYPPPPTGIITESKSELCASTSKPATPCPAIIRS